MLIGKGRCHIHGITLAYYYINQRTDIGVSKVKVVYCRVCSLKRRTEEYKARGRVVATLLK